jgi:beta-N-acetylhexosaminidase
VATPETFEFEAAQLCWVTVHGGGVEVPHEANRRAFGVSTPAEVIRRFRPGGVVLFSWADNTQHPEQVASLTTQLHAVAAEFGYSLGVAIDEEGGRVSRLPAPATAFPSARALAAVDDDASSLDRWRATGRELAALGVTVDLAPVVDLAHPDNPVLGDRSFGHDVGTVVHQAALAVRGLAEEGVAAVAKHFPGHGATGVDSHLDLPVVGVDEDVTAHVDAFRRLLAVQPPAGIMPGHLLVRPLDAEQPATLSPHILNRLLRDELGFEGATVSDSLAMAGIRKGRDDAQVALAALQAGVDVLLTPPDLPRAIAVIAQAVRDGRLSEARLSEAAERARPLREPRRGPRREPRSDVHDRPREHVVGAPGHRALAQRLARRSISIHGHRELVPVAGAVVVAGAAGSGAGELAAALKSHGRPVTLVEFAWHDVGAARLAAAGLADDDEVAPPGAGVRTEALAGALTDCRLVLVRRVPELDPAGQERLLAPLVAGRDDVVLVDTGGDGPEAAWAACRIHGYGADAATIGAMAELLTAGR